MVDFFTQFGRIRTPEDFQRAREEFELNKQFKRSQMDVQKAQIAKAQKEAENPLSGAPATLQINAAIQKALDAGDYETANRIAWLQRSQAYGIDTFSPQGNTPETFEPFTPKQQPAAPSAAPSLPAPQPEAPMGQGIVPEYETPEYVPTGQSIMPAAGGNSISAQQARNAAMKKAAEKEAELRARMGLEPKLEADIAAAKKKAEEGVEEEKRNKTRARVTNRLSDIAGYYNDLSAMGAAVDPEQGILQNIRARAGASKVGQFFGEYLGSPEQEVRQKIEQMRPTLLSDIRVATEMGAKGLDSEKELEFYLQAVSDPRRSIGANMAALQVLNEAYGLRASDFGATPEDIERLKQEFNKQTAPRRSGARQEIEEMQNKFETNNDINQLLEMYAPR